MACLQIGHEPSDQAFGYCVATSQRSASAAPANFPLRIEVAEGGIEQRATDFVPELTARLLSKLTLPPVGGTVSAVVQVSLVGAPPPVPPACSRESHVSAQP
jgi:hypothetical protein